MIPLFKPYMPDLPDIDSILHSGVLTNGIYTKAFEDALKEYFGTQYLIVTNNFHTAISTAITTYGLTFGDCVVSSPMGCIASMQPYLCGGIKVCWADVDPETGTLSPDSVRRQIKSGIKAIIHNHFCGYPGYIDEINEIGREYGIPVIDDGIECFGSEYKGQKIGNCGTDITVFSLNAVRFCNCVDGGIVIFKDRSLYEKGILVRDCGIDRSRFRDQSGEINPECDISVTGYSATMSNVNGYIGIRQMEVIGRLLERHRKQARKWDAFFYGQSIYVPIHREDCYPNYWIYGILSDDKIKTVNKFRENGYYASGVHMRNDVYSVFGRQYVELPGVDEFYRRFVALPCGWWMD